MEKIAENVLVWTNPATIEEGAIRQIKNIAGMPFIFKHVAIMPDCHLGKGATVGSVIATKGAIMPAAVGVDIGCGMIAVKTKFNSHGLPTSLKAIRDGIERRVPLGAGGRNTVMTESVQRRVAVLEHRSLGEKEYDSFDSSWRNQLGTLGSGNHFIEICLDQDDQVWIVLHSGSRGIGNKIASRHIKIAQNLMDNFFIPLADRDLAYLPEGRHEFSDYIHDLLWAQEFALDNREEMMDRVMTELSWSLYREDGHQDEIELERINCHHNFTQQENHFGQNVWVTRKGAIEMRPGQRGIIPGSMGTRSYIVSGLGNKLSYNSAPHGAGRRFSRNEAKRRFTMADYDKAMAGIECRRSEQLIDELPGAYKDIDQVMEYSKDLVRVDHVLKQILNVKGD